MTDEEKIAEVEAVLDGLYVTDDEYGACSLCGGTPTYINLGKQHWFFCKKHKITWWGGTNCISLNWDYECLETQTANVRKLDGFIVFKRGKPWCVFVVAEAIEFINEFWNRKAGAYDVDAYVEDLRADHGA